MIIPERKIVSNVHYTHGPAMRNGNPQFLAIPGVTQSEPVPKLRAERMGNDEKG